MSVWGFLTDTDWAGIEMMKTGLGIEEGRGNS